MRKVLSILVIFTLLAGTVPTKAVACLFGDCGPADQLIRENQRMVSRWSRPYYDGHDHYYSHGHHSNDGWIGLGLGVVAGALVYGALSNRDNQAAVPPPTGGGGFQPSSSGFNNSWNERLRDQWFDDQGCQKDGKFTLKNESGEFIRVYKDGWSFTVLRPRESTCGDPFASYEGEVVVAVSDGYTATTDVARSKPEGRKGGVWVWR